MNSIGNVETLVLYGNNIDEEAHNNNIIIQEERSVLLTNCISRLQLNTIDTKWAHIPRAILLIDKNLLVDLLSQISSHCAMINCRSGPCHNIQ